jgi:hypothetical protein
MAKFQLCLNVPERRQERILLNEAKEGVIIINYRLQNYTYCGENRAEVGEAHALDDPQHGVHKNVHLTTKIMVTVFTSCSRILVTRT